MEEWETQTSYHGYFSGLYKSEHLAGTSVSCETSSCEVRVSVASPCFPDIRFPQCVSFTGYSLYYCDVCSKCWYANGSVVTGY